MIKNVLSSTRVCILALVGSDLLVKFNPNQQFNKYKFKQGG